MPRLPAALVVLLAAATITAQIRTEGVLAKGTRFETPYHVVKSPTPGPTVMIVSGVHGNEPAGPRAADQIRHWPILRGKLVVLPRANLPALSRDRRYTPATPAGLRDLNRNFPRTEREEPRGPAAGAIWDLVASLRPDWLIELHEGHDVRRRNPNSFGRTVIFVPTPETRQAAVSVLERVNADVRSDERKFLLLRYPTPGSLARAAADRLGARSMVFRTTLQAPVSERVRRHRTMVHELLDHLGMAGDGADRFFSARSPGDVTVRVALYDAAGTNRGPGALDRDLGLAADIVTHRIGPAEIRAGALRQFDVLVQPGGKSRVQSRALGDAGREAIREFVRSGGGYVGFCAGAYLATTASPRFLGILEARLVDVRHRLRGHGTVEIELTPHGRAILGNHPGLIEVRYANGPVLRPVSKRGLDAFQALAFYRSEIVSNGADKGVMQNTPAVAADRFGQGRVLCFSPHPEYTKGLESFVYRAVRWAAGRGGEGPRGRGVEGPREEGD